MTFDIEETDRQMLLMALAMLSLRRPSLDSAAADLAEKLEGREMFDELRRFAGPPLLRKAEERS